MNNSKGEELSSDELSNDCERCEKTPVMYHCINCCGEVLDIKNESDVKNHGCDNPCWLNPSVFLYEMSIVVKNQVTENINIRAIQLGVIVDKVFGKNILDIDWYIVDSDTEASFQYDVTIDCDITIYPLDYFTKLHKLAQVDSFNFKSIGTTDSNLRLIFTDTNYRPPEHLDKIIARRKTIEALVKH